VVDCVLYLEGTNDYHNLRMLRATKNRFGSTDEVGVYEMTAGRLVPVSDPSSLLLSHRLDSDDKEGCAITLAMEGLRAMTVEIQALVTASSGNPLSPAASASKRTVNGISYSRLALLLGGGPCQTMWVVLWTTRCLCQCRGCGPTRQHARE